MADSFFFINTSSAVTQNLNTAFGPVVGSESSQFRVTSKFSSTADVPAYAAFTAQVFLQPSTEADKVNLILRPYRQSIKGLAVKYFIYRGLKKTDFIPIGNEDLIGYGQKDTASGFIKLLWDQIEKFDEESIEKAFKAKWIGYDPATQAGDTIIDDYFFMADAYGDDENESLKPFELPIVTAGTHLGNFNGNFGLDVVLSDGDYKPLTSKTGFQFNLTYARATEAIINTASIPFGYSEKQYREAVLDFMDPAAFYGLHVSDGAVKINNGSGVNILKGNQIYEQAISKFATKNKVYIHIQGHLGRSYNYYGSYFNLLGNSNIIRLGIDAENILPNRYSTNSWPIIIQEENQDHNTDTNKLYLQLVYSAEATPLLFGQVAKLVEEAENNFLKTDQLIPEVTEIENDDPLLDLYTKPVSLFIPAVGNSSNKANIASYIKLLYKGSELEALNSNTGAKELIKPIDTLFGPVNIEQRLASASDDVISWSSYYKNRLVQTNDIDSKAPNNKIVLQSKIIGNKIAFEENEIIVTKSFVVYETQFFEGISDGLYLNSFPQNESSSASTIPFIKEQNNTYKLESPNYIATEFFTDGFTTIKGLRIYNTLKEYPNKFILGLSELQNNILKTLITTRNLNNASMFLSPLSSDGSLFISTENLFYGKYKLGVLSDPSSEPHLFFPEQDIIVYSLDENIYFSQEYSQYIQDDSVLVFDLTIERTL